jgi:hypothetical protein
VSRISIKLATSHAHQRLPFWRAEAELRGLSLGELTEAALEAALLGDDSAGDLADQVERLQQRKRAGK